MTLAAVAAAQQARAQRILDRLAESEAAELEAAEVRAKKERKDARRQRKLAESAEGLVDLGIKSEDYEFDVAWRSFIHILISIHKKYLQLSRETGGG